MPGPSFEYTPRRPETTVLYRVVAEQLESFLVRQQQRGRPIPGFVEEEFRSFLQCGIEEFGFLRLHCDDCGKDSILPFSCYPELETICSSIQRRIGEVREYRASYG